MTFASDWPCKPVNHFGLSFGVGAVRQTSPSIGSRLTAIFYEITKERHSVRAASRLSLNVERFESDRCELKRL